MLVRRCGSRGPRPAHPPGSGLRAEPPPGPAPAPAAARGAAELPPPPLLPPRPAGPRASRPGPLRSPPPLELTSGRPPRGEGAWTPGPRARLRVWGGCGWGGGVDPDLESGADGGAGARGHPSSHRGCPRGTPDAHTGDRTGEGSCNQVGAGESVQGSDPGGGNFHEGSSSAPVLPPPRGIRDDARRTGGGSCHEAAPGSPRTGYEARGSFSCCPGHKAPSLPQGLSRPHVQDWLLQTARCSLHPEEVKPGPQHHRAGPGSSWGAGATLPFPSPAGGSSPSLCPQPTAWTADRPREHPWAQGVPDSALTFPKRAHLESELRLPGHRNSSQGPGSSCCPQQEAGNQKA